MEDNTCRFCGSKEDLCVDSKRQEGDKLYVYYACRPCNTCRAQRYRKTASGKQAVKKAVEKYEKSNRDRRKAWYVAGKIQKRPCEVCGEAEVHRHHPDIKRPDYIVFLCPLHHKKEHRKMLTTMV